MVQLVHKQIPCNTILGLEQIPYHTTTFWSGFRMVQLVLEQVLYGTTSSQTDTMQYNQFLNMFHTVRLVLEQVPYACKTSS